MLFVSVTLFNVLHYDKEQNPPANDTAVSNEYLKVQCAFIHWTFKSNHVYL